MAVAAVRASGLTKDYGGGQGVFGLELQVSAGETFGLFGPAGSGKSTALRLLMGMIRPTRGAAYVFGLDCVRESVEAKRRVGYIPDRQPRFGSLRGAEVVTYIASLRGGVVHGRAHELARRLDLDLGRRHIEYSPGERQKLSVVLAFMHEPDLLLLDEPAQDLDVSAEGELHALMGESRARGATILIASRTTTGIEKHGDRAAILRSGTLSAAMRVGELTTGLEGQNRGALPP
jgi:ABC-2 type transport system ATP-binding protein